jgi:hypothetical protein
MLFYINNSVARRIAPAGQLVFLLEDRFGRITALG